MATKYQSQIDNALRLIQAKGMPLTLRKATGGGIDPVTQTDTRTFTSQVGVGVNLPTGAVGKESSAKPGTVPAGRKAAKFLVAAKGLTFPPEAGDEITIGALAWEILSVDSLAPDGTPIIHTVIAAQ
jgi:hypothetical protein